MIYAVILQNLEKTKIILERCAQALTGNIVYHNMNPDSAPART